VKFQPVNTKNPGTSLHKGIEIYVDLFCVKRTLVKMIKFSLVCSSTRIDNHL